MSYGMNSSRGNTSTGANIGPTATGNMREKIPSGYKKGVLQNFDPNQMQLFQQLFQHVAPGSYLSKLAGGDESLFNEMEAPALRQFSGLQGNLASRFSGMGMGGRHSSGFQNTANQAASDFAQDLQSRRQGLMRQAIQDLMGLSGDLLNQRPYDQFLVPKQEKEGFNWGGLGGAALGGLGGFFAGGGNPLTAISGASTGYNIGSSFSGRK
jgi:hypothetical protein